jgi:hypothetical protein
VCVGGGGGFGSNGFVTNDAAIPNGWSLVISGVGHQRSDLVIPLVLRMLCCANGWGTSIVLQVPQDSVNLAEKG